jgi:putative acyl-CoA dehydrogenase
MNPTHEVFNQPAPLADYNLFETNRPLRDALSSTRRRWIRLS